MDSRDSGKSSQEERNDGKGTETTMEIRIKTLDSQVYTCRVQPNISVLALKEQAASLTGVPAENQRLIYRGRVLKDDHLLAAYNIEDGHALHLVTRKAPQPSLPSTSAGVGRRDVSSENQGSADTNPPVPSNTHSQVPRSVVLGSFDIPDHVETGMPDVSRIVSSVLGSLGVGNMMPGNASGGSVTVTILPNQMQQSPGIDGQGRVNVTSRRSQEEGNSGQQAPSSVNGSLPTREPPVESVNGLRSDAFAGANPHLRLLQQAMVVPDAFTTMSQYLNRMEQVLTANGSAVRQTYPNVQTQLPDNQPSSRAYPTPAVLASIIRRMQQLLTNQAGAVLAGFASQLENESQLSDGATRGDLQATSLRSGILLQHLGALLLELGRTTMTVRLGSSPSEAIVNSGPAVFISPSGPNPMMVQPVPFQPGGVGALGSILTGLASQHAMGGPTEQLASGGEMPRNISIHVLTGEAGRNNIPLVPTVPVPPHLQPNDGRPASATPTFAFSHNANAPSVNSASPLPPQGGSPPFGDQVNIRVVPVRTLVATVPAATMQTQPSVVDPASAAAGVVYPLLARFQQLNPAQAPQGVVASTTHSTSPEQVPINSASIPATEAAVGIETGSGSTTGGSILQGPQTNGVLSAGARSAGQNNEDMSQNRGGERDLSLSLTPLHPNVDKVEQARELQFDPKSTESQRKGFALKAESSSSGTNASLSSKGEQDKESGNRACEVPVGLGLGGLRPLPPSKRSQKQNQQTVAATSSAASENKSNPGSRGNEALPASGDGQNILRDLMASLSSRPEAASSVASGGQARQRLSQLLNNGESPPERSVPDGGINIGDLMSRMMGGSQTARSGNDQAMQQPSLGGLGGFMGQMMQSPLFKNVFDQVMQQVGDEPEGIERTMSQGLSGPGGFDLAPMLQQMMPIVTQALSRATDSLDGPSIRVEENGESVKEQGTTSQGHAQYANQVDMGAILQKLEEDSSSLEDILESVAEVAAVSIEATDSDVSTLVEHLSHTEGLANEYMALLLDDLALHAATKPHNMGE